MHVAIVYSLPSKRMQLSGYGETDEDSAIIADKVKLGLESKGMTTSTYMINEDAIEDILEVEADCIFNLIEWCGQDITLAQKAFTYLRKLQIPVTGANEELFVLTGDKVRVKERLQTMGVPTPESQVFVNGDEVIVSLTYPVIVKPALEHCSMGLTYDSIAYSADKLRSIVKRQIETFHQCVIVEKFIVGRELLVYLLQDKEQVTVLPIEEVVFTGDNPLAFQTYASKWEVDHPDYKTSNVVLAKLSAREQKVIESTCVKIFTQMGFCGYARFDMRLRDGVPYVLECNANPSVYDTHDNSLGVEDEVIWGIKFGDYLEKIVLAAVDCFKIHLEKSSIGVRARHGDTRSKS